VADEDDIAQIFHLEERDDVGDMGVEVDVRPRQVRAFAQAGERRRKHFMSLEERADETPAPAAVPGAMHEYEISHARF
jgi:hypothetical protein